MPHPSRLVEITCATCGKTKSIPLSQHKRCKSGRYFCSPDCRWIGLRTKKWTSCSYCGKEFICPNDRLRKANNVFCSQKCNGLFNQKREIVKCSQCGKEISLCPSQIALYEKKFCSGRCYGDWRSENLIGENCVFWKGGPPIKICSVCGKEFIAKLQTKEANESACSKECRSKLFSRKYSLEGNPNWRGGSSFEPYPTDFNSELKLRIRERDSFICQECGEPEDGKSLHVHHIDYDKMNCEERNLITLCEICHTKTNFNREYWQTHFMEKLK